MTQHDLVERVQPQPDWRILLMAGSSTELVTQFAPHVSHLTLVCRSPEQMQKSKEAAADAQQNNVIFAAHDPNQLPYNDSSFDLVICHHYAHELPDTTAWLSQASRVIRTQGLLVTQTLSVPGTRLRGKKARKLRESAEYINAMCQLHNPTHQRFYSKNQWEDLLIEANFNIHGVSTCPKWFDFSAWIDKSSLAQKDVLRLRAMLIQAPEKAHEFLTPQFSGDRIDFRLPEITILAISKENRV